MPHFIKFGLLLLLSFQLQAQAEIVSLNHQRNYDAIIVPGVPHNGQNWSSTMRDRVLWSVYLYKSGHAKNVIYSGSAVYTAYEEAAVMALYAEQLGIPREHIFLDSRAEHTTENIYYSYQIAKKQQFECIAFATDPFQGYSMKSFIKKFEFPIDIFPIDYDTLSSLMIQEPKINPELAKRDAFTSIVERESKWKRFRGTMGQNIRWQAEDLKKKRLKKKYANRVEQAQ
jgi:uncharacterized SAM-binding protein YcdF (DUF218 family)